MLILSLVDVEDEDVIKYAKKIDELLEKKGKSRIGMHVSKCLYGVFTSSSSSKTFKTQSVSSRPRNSVGPDGEECGLPESPIGGTV